MIKKTTKKTMCIPARTHFNSSISVPYVLVIVQYTGKRQSIKNILYSLIFFSEVHCTYFNNIN